MHHCSPPGFSYSDSRSYQGAKKKYVIVLNTSSGSRPLDSGTVGLSGTGFGHSDGAGTTGLSPQDAWDSQDSQIETVKSMQSVLRSPEADSTQGR